MNDNLREARVDNLNVRDQDFHGRRITNAGDSKADQDYVTRKELNSATNQSILIKLIESLLNKARNIVTKLISPPTDSTTAIEFTKADQRTVILTMDTVNNRFIIPSTYDLFFGSTTNRLRIMYSTATQFAVINAYDGANYRPINIDAGTTGLQLNVTSNGPVIVGGATSTIGFFNAAAAAKQTLNAYTSDGEGVAYTGNTLSTTSLQYKDHAGVNQTLSVVTGPLATSLALVSELNQLRVAYETLRASYDDLRTKLQNTTLVA
jgi:hypothetical protein